MAHPEVNAVHRNTAGHVVIHWIAPLALAAFTAALCFVSSPGFAVTALLLFVADELVIVHLVGWSGWCTTRYVNKDQTIALVVKVLPDSSWKPDTHIKEPEVPKEDTAVFWVSVMAHLLEAATRNAVILKMTARDEKPLKSYVHEQDLKKAQEKMGMPLAEFRPIEILGKNWICGFNCAIVPPFTASVSGWSDRICDFWGSSFLRMPQLNCPAVSKPLGFEAPRFRGMPSWTWRRIGCP